MAYEDFDALARSQAGQSRQVGARAADIADPFATERDAYKKSLRDFMANPQGSPAYQFSFNQGLDALTRRAAATGKTGSGNYLADLMRFGQGLASQDYYKQGNFLAKLAGVDSSSPAAAALALTGGFNRGQDQDSISAVARAMRNQQPQQQPQQNWMQQMAPGGRGTGLPPTGLPSGGYALPNVYDTPFVTANTPGYTPSASAGTGYVMSDYGAQDLSGPGSQYYSFGTPSGAGDIGGYDGGWQTPSDMSYDYGGYDYGGEE